MGTNHGVAFSGLIIFCEGLVFWDSIDGSPLCDIIIQRLAYLGGELDTFMHGLCE